MSEAKKADEKARKGFLFPLGFTLSILLFLLALGQIVLASKLSSNGGIEALPSEVIKSNDNLLKEEWTFEVINASENEGLDRVGSLILEDAGYEVIRTGAEEPVEGQTNTLIFRQDMTNKVEHLIADLERYFDIVTVRDDLPFATANARLILTELK